MTSTPVQQNCDSRSPGGREASALPAVRGVSGKALRLLRSSSHTGCRSRTEVSAEETCLRLQSKQVLGKT